jgi:hypothetical protein
MRRGLHSSPFSLGLREVQVHENSNRDRLRHKLAQQLKPLRYYRGRKKAHAGYVATRSTEAGDEAIDDRVAAGHEHDW